MAILIEMLAEIAKEDFVDPGVHKRCVEIIEKAFKLVPAEVPGAFLPKMNLLVFLCRIQQAAAAA
jgi:hypothetical protein